MGSTALRLEDVQQPKTATTFLSLSSFFACLEKTVVEDRPSSTTGSISNPSTPPAALISSIAKSSVSRSAVSLMAILPVWEWSKPTFTFLRAGRTFTKSHPANIKGARLPNEPSIKPSPLRLRQSRRVIPPVTLSVVSINLSPAINKSFATEDRPRHFAD